MSNSSSFWKNYRMLICMIGAIVAGCVLGFMYPVVTDADGNVVSHGAAVLAPLGKIFINLMFCVVVPLVFSSIAGAVANMASPARAARIMGATISIFVITGVIASALMIFLVKIFPPVLEPWTSIAAGEVGQMKSFSDLLVGFFTAEDFVAILSRRAMLPLIIFSILFGFGVQMHGGPESPVAHGLSAFTECMLNVVKMLTYYAPIAFFGFFADLAATYGPTIAGAYGRALIVYYPTCFLYAAIAFPIFAYFGGGPKAPGILMRNIARPALTSLGTCSSAATIPTNLEVAAESGIPRDVSDIVLPLGATMHMDGSCLSCVLKLAFIYGVFGLPFEGLDTYALATVVAVLSSVGMSGIPGGGYIGEFILCSVFFPDKLELAFPIAVTIGNLVDPPATMVNSSGDYAVSFLAARFVNGRDWLEKSLSATKD